ncbi:PIF-2 [Crangon crangon nudivirus]|uniref:PIF-2 n=1 Tax=Crangon crangon nudivirus TaxID=2880838 RepID=A0AAE8Y3B0_9VIRU|nr:PIF-2 [Crangon crangon nudivirus]UBZ25493.1 PIF-2 [Crangon crangon nudivirus]
MDLSTKSKLGSLYLLVLSLVVCAIILYSFTFLKVDVSEYTKYVQETTTEFLNQDIVNLTMANTLSNLPHINIVTNNSDIEQLQLCKDNILYMGPVVDNEEVYSKYRATCKFQCGAQGDLISVTKDQEFYYNNKAIAEGVWCALAPQPCNMNTGYVQATVNSTVCRTKYPALFGGPVASNIIACNDENYIATGSVLWDYANNEAVDPVTIVMTDEQEQLPDGSYRFRCKYNETVMGNKYIAHPLDRFHPIPDPCNNTIYRADYSVGVKYADNTWHCDCGDSSITRVKNLDSLDPKSTCTSCFKDRTNDQFKVPYICFNTSSIYSMPKDHPPCIDSFDAKGGNSCASITLNVKKLEKQKISNIPDDAHRRFNHALGYLDLPYMHTKNLEFDKDKMYIRKQVY